MRYTPSTFPDNIAEAGGVRQSEEALKNLFQGRAGIIHSGKYRFFEEACPGLFFGGP